jgi:endonuclease/exonuclease/phosphatase (EEP) superfamily protein YafD
MLKIQSSIQGLFRNRRDLLALVPLTMAAAVAVSAIWKPGSGILALAVVLEAQLLIVVLVVLAPIAFAVRSRAIGVALVLLLVAGLGRFGSEWISLPNNARHDLTVLTWNIQEGARTPAELTSALDGETVDLIGLQEVEPDAAAAIGADATLKSHYPYQVLAPAPGSRGISVLSRYPIRDTAEFTDPSIIELTVEAPRGPVRVIVAHPTPSWITTITPLRIPVDYDPSIRDELIAHVRGHIDAALASGQRLLVLGDYNTSPSEAEYPILTRGLRDTQVEVGDGPGWTWRPSRFTQLPVAFLRIDLQLTAGKIAPASTGVDCSLAGDHCRLYGAYEID